VHCGNHFRDETDVRIMDVWSWNEETFVYSGEPGDGVDIVIDEKENRRALISADEMRMRLQDNMRWSSLALMTRIRMSSS
jgi:hypothetical protein